MGYQFLHVEAYGREAGKSKNRKKKAHSIRSIIAEAAREPGNFDPKIVEPHPPVPVFGCSLEEVEALATAWGDESRDAIGRGIRKSGHCLLAGVISAPDEMTSEEWEGMKLDAVDWLNRDGRLVSVVEHVDESHRHFHFFKIPAPGARFETIHPGRAAALKSKAGGGKIKDQSRAYCEAMRALQDDFFEKVGARYGLTRLGPGKRRLTRQGWHHEQAAAVAAGKAMAAAQKQTAEARVAIAEASGVKADIASALAEATASLDRAKAEAMAGAEKAKADADKAVEAKTEAAASRAAAVELASKAKADAAKAEAVLEANAKTVQKLTRQKEAMALVARRIGADRAELEVWASRGGRIGGFFGRLFSTASSVFSLRGMRERQLGRKLQAAERSAAVARARAAEAEAKAKRREWEKDALTQRHEKAIRAIDADRVKMGQELEALKKQPAGGIKPPPAKRLRS